MHFSNEKIRQFYELQKLYAFKFFMVSDPLLEVKTEITKFYQNFPSYLERMSSGFEPNLLHRYQCC